MSADFPSFGAVLNIATTPTRPYIMPLTYAITVTVKDKAGNLVDIFNSDGTPKSNPFTNPASAKGRFSFKAAPNRPYFVNVVEPLSGATIDMYRPAAVEFDWVQIGGEDFKIMYHEGKGTLVQKANSAWIPYVPEPVGPTSFDYTSDVYWVPNGNTSVGDVNDEYLQWTGEFWINNDGSTTRNGAINPNIYGPGAGWQVGFRPARVELTLNSGPANDSFGFLNSTDFWILDGNLDVIGVNDNIGFESWDQTKVFNIDLDWTDRLDIAELRYETFLYNTGPRIQKIEFFMDPLV